MSHDNMTSNRIVYYIYVRLIDNRCYFVGCWQKSDDKYCTVGPCVANRRSTKAKYCCCYGNLCNTNMSDIYDPSQHTTEDPQYSGKTFSDF